VVTIEDESAGGRIIGTLDELSAMTQLHDHAVYLHGGETFFVEELDLTVKIARVVRRDLEYYTQAITVSRIRVDEVEEDRSAGGAEIGFGDVTVTTTIPMFKKVRFHSRESLGFERLELPEQCVETVATWFAPDPATAPDPADLGEALLGVANVLVEVVPVYLMCDTTDVGAAVDSTRGARTGLFLYDRFPGGMGYARGALDRFDELMETVRDVIRDCPCEGGCPSCVGSAVPAVAANDLDTSVRGRLPDKAAALSLVTAFVRGRGGTPSEAAGMRREAAETTRPAAIPR
jgi:DEAD/DEAH box helicase domain-containing protein